MLELNGSVMRVLWGNTEWRRADHQTTRKGL